MFTKSSPEELLYIGAAVPFCVVLLWWTISTLPSPLRTYPGLLLANWTNLWRLYQVRTHKYQWSIQELHRKYGPVVRIGPNLLDLDYPELIKAIYGTGNKWLKTNFYLNNSVVVDGEIKHNLFSTRNPTEHAQVTRHMARYYSSSNVLRFEAKTNRVIDEFSVQIDERYLKRGQPFDVAEWLGLYNWDMIGSLTSSQSFGYMKSGHDFDGAIRASALSVDYFAQIGLIPFLDWSFNRNPIVLIGSPDMNHITQFSIAQLLHRLTQRGQEKPSEEPDFLDHFIDGRQSNPESVDAKLVPTFLLANVLVGADTTAIALRANFDFLLQNPHAMSKLRGEILAQDFNDAEIVPFVIARSPPYLDGFIRESLRMHPSVAMPLERCVPEIGLTLPNGSFVFLGVAVSLSPYIIGRNKEVCGEDADGFRPERWLRMEDENEDYQRRLRKMNGAELSFGGGSKICIDWETYCAHSNLQGCSYFGVAIRYSTCESKGQNVDDIWMVSTSNEFVCRNAQKIGNDEILDRKRTNLSDLSTK